MRKQSIVLAALALAAVPSLSRADYRVTTDAKSQVSESNMTIEAAYNFLGSGYHTSGGGADTSFTANPTDSAGTATASTDTTNVSSSFPGDPLTSQPPASASASASANADLAAAKIGVSATGTYLDYVTPSSGQAGGSSSAFAQIADTLHFSVPGASAATVTDITISFRIDGDMTITTAAGDSEGELQPILQINSSQFRETISSGPADYTPAISNIVTTNWVSAGFSSNTPSLIIFNGVFSITGPTADVSIAETLSASGGLGTSTDYQHTAAFSLTAPDGVTYTSDSGVFLTAPLPEPSALLALLPGMALLRARRRR